MTVAVHLARRELTVEDIAALTGDAIRSVRRRVSAWFSAQGQRGTPVVRRARLPWEGRWQYLVDADSYETARTHLPPAVGSDAAVRAGCTCLPITTADGGAGALVAASCPVHGALLGG